MHSLSSRLLSKIGAYASVFLLSLLLAGCFGNRSGSNDSSDDPSASEPTPRGLFGAAREGISAARGMAEAAEAYAEQRESGIRYEVVDFRELRDRLPESAAGLERSDIQGERQGMGGEITISKANATYNNEDHSNSIEISVMDGAGTQGIFMMFGAAWTMIDIDRESSDGFERTSTFEGNKSYEKYSESNQSGELQVVIAGRFLLSVNGRGVSMDDIYNAARAVDLRGLEAMREAGRTEVES